MTWANQVRILRQQFEALGAVIGGTLINALKPLVKALNAVMSKIISFAQTVSNALGKIFGWKYEVGGGGGVADDFEDAAGSADDMAGSTGKAADNAKKLKQQLQGFDELNVLTSNDDADAGGGSGGGAGAGGGGGAGDGGWVRGETIFEDYESELDTLYKLGDYIGTKLSEAMESIDWDSVYEKARNFGTGLASFLNGLISPRLFGNLGKTIANSLNAALYALNSFGKTFDWKDFGESIATGINEFFKNFDFKNLADTINVWVDGIADTIKSFFSTLDFKEIFRGLFEFLEELELDSVSVIIGAFAWMHGGKELVAETFKNILKKQIGLTGTEGGATISLSTTLAISVTTAIVGFKIGNYLYENVPTVKQWSDALGDWIFKDGEEIAIPRTITVLLGGLTFSLGTVAIGEAIKNAITKAVTTASAEASLSGTGVGAIILAKIGTAVSKATTAITSLATTIGTTISAAITAAGGIGAIATAAAILAGTIVAVIAAALGGFSFGQLIYEWVNEEEIDMSWAEQFEEIKNSFSDGSWEDALSLWKDDITTNMIALAEDEEKLMQPIKDKFTEFKELFSDGQFSSAMELWKQDIDDALTVTAGKIDTWYTEKVAPWFTKEKWKTLGDNIKTSLSEKWNDFSDWWGDTAIVNWWNNNVSPWFTTEKWNFDGIKNGLSSAWSGAVEAIKQIWNQFANWLNPKLVFKIDPVVIAGKTVFEGGTINLGKLPTFATGGFPEDGLFMANHNELVGKFANGKTAVANNKQITDGIAIAVQNANQEQNNLLRKQNDLLLAILEKETGITQDAIGRSARNYAMEYQRRTGRPAYDF